MYSLLELAISVGVLLTLVYVLSSCVCGCKNSNQKSELVGTAGVVTIRDEEAPSPTPTTPASIKRATSQNNQRSLPEIPHPVGRHDSGDTASDTYATVNLDEANKIIPIPTSSRSHEYDQTIYAIPQKENRTPEVVIDPIPNGDIPIDERDASQMGPDSVVISASVAISGQLASSNELPYITPPPVQHFSGDSTDSAKGYTSISVRPPLSNIRAAMLLNKPQGGVYASVSDDSDDMYAHIEGQSGSETYAQIAPLDARRSHEVARTTTGDVTRRSAPPEIGSTSNTTHSRQASSSSFTTPCALGSPKPEKRQANSPLPPPPAGPPPSTHPPHPPHPAHPPHTLTQRQQRIASTGDLHFNHDKARRSLNEKHQRNNSCVSSSDGLQTFYGCNYPVEKHRFSSGDLIRPLVAKELKFDIDAQNSTTSKDVASTSTEQRITESPSRNVEEMYAKVIKKMKTIEDPPRSAVEPTKYRDDPGYETIDRKASHGYETIPHKERKVSQNQDPGYETVKDKSDLSLTNNNLLSKLTDSGPNSIISSDPGYEHIAKNENSASDSDPNYDNVVCRKASETDPNYDDLCKQPSTPPYATIAPNYKLPPMYSVVNKKAIKPDWTSNNNEEAILEPNYESMPNDPLYTTGSESDPNYESVRPKSNYECVDPQDPNYESIRRKDPKYESVRSKDPNYESVKYSEVGKREHPYEKVSGTLQRSDSAGYEKIEVPKNRDSKSSISGEGGTVSDYFQV